MKKLILATILVAATSITLAQTRTRCQPVEFAEMQAMSDAELRALKVKLMELIAIPVEPGSKPSMTDEYRACYREIERVTAMTIRRLSQ